MPESEKQLPDVHSKTKRKNDMLDLQKLGMELLRLPEGQLAKIPLPDDLREAFSFARTLKANESLRRHMQLIGKKMRAIDADEVKAALNNVLLNNAMKTTQFHEAEEWRDKLIAKGDDELNDFLKRYPESDRQQLRQLIRKAQHDKAKNKNTGGATALFRYLRDVMA